MIGTLYCSSSILLQLPCFEHALWQTGAGNADSWQTIFRWPVGPRWCGQTPNGRLEYPSCSLFSSARYLCCINILTIALSKAYAPRQRQQKSKGLAKRTLGHPCVLKSFLFVPLYKVTRNIYEVLKRCIDKYGPLLLHRVRGQCCDLLPSTFNNS